MCSKKEESQMDGHYHSIPNFKGVRKRYIGKTVGYGHDWTYCIQFREGKNVRTKTIGKASDGWTPKKVHLELLRIMNQFKENIAEEHPEKKNKTLSKKKNKEVIKEVEPEEQEQGITLFSLWEEYSYIKKDTLSKKSLGAFADKFRLLKDLYFIPVEKITTKDVQNLRKKIETMKSAKGKPYAPQTIKHVLVLLRTLINFGVRRGICKKHDNLYFDMPKFDNRVTEVLTDEQVQKYLECLEEETDLVGVGFLKTAFYTGMRKKAIIGLKWDDVDFENNTIMLRAEEAKKKRTDYIPLPQPVKEAMLKLPRNSEYIFPNKNGEKRSDFVKMAQRIKKKVGLPEHYRCVYMLRHNFASHLASSGEVDLYTIQKLLTHESPEMTQRYAHLHDKALRKGTSVIENIFAKK